MTLEFINKRINEQSDEMLDIWFRHIHSEIDIDRFNELYESAKSQYEYFANKWFEIKIINAVVQKQLT